MESQLLVEVVGTFGTFGVVIFLLLHNLNMNKDKEKYNRELNEKFITLSERSAKAIENSNTALSNNTKAVDKLQDTLSDRVYDILRK